MTSKNCTKCRILKPLTEFGVYKARKDGTQSLCRVCMNNQSAKRVKTKEGLVTRIYFSQRFSSRKRHHQMPSYTLIELRKWALSQPIYHSLHMHWKALGYQMHMTPSFDRLDDYKPYTFDNLQIITWAENNAKAYADKKNGINNKNSKTIIQMTLSGEFVAEYYSAMQASRSTGVRQGSISRCCSGKAKHAGGHIWRYV